VAVAGARESLVLSNRGFASSRCIRDADTIRSTGPAPQARARSRAIPAFTRRVGPGGSILRALGAARAQRRHRRATGLSSPSVRDLCGRRRLLRLPCSARAAPRRAPVVPAELMLTEPRRVVLELCTTRRGVRMRFEGRMRVVLSGSPNFPVLIPAPRNVTCASGVSSYLCGSRPESS